MLPPGAWATAHLVDGCKVCAACQGIPLVCSTQEVDRLRVGLVEGDCSVSSGAVSPGTHARSKGAFLTLDPSSVAKKAHQIASCLTVNYNKRQWASVGRKGRRCGLVMAVSKSLWSYSKARQSAVPGVRPQSTHIGAPPTPSLPGRLNKPAIGAGPSLGQGMRESTVLLR